MSKKKRRNDIDYNDNSINKFRLRNVTPKSARQDELLRALYNYPLVVGLGPAGTGKSFIGAYAACRALLEGSVDKIVITRNPLPVGSSLGYFAGSESEKLAIWLGPIISTLKKILKTDSGSDGFFEYLVSKKKIEYLPMEVAKGASYEKAFIIVEEAQECDLEQLKVLTTRVGTDSVIFLNGDVRQSNSKLSSIGFQKLIDAFERENGYSITAPAEWDSIYIPVVEFGTSDIVRSDITRKVVSIFEKYNL